MLPPSRSWLEENSLYSILLPLCAFHGTYHFIWAFSPLEVGEASYLPSTE